MQIMPFIWIGLAIVMAVCEAATAQLVSIWFVLGAICAVLFFEVETLFPTIFSPAPLFFLRVI